IMFDHQIGNSLFDKKGALIVPDLIAKAKKNGVKIILPIDFVAADDFSQEANTKLCTAEEGIPEGWEGLDCGPASRALYKEACDKAATIVWNGPPGVFEIPQFANGTNELIDAVCAATKRGAVTVIGGGDSATAIMNAGKGEGVSHISTGGGASIELLQGNVMPGIEVLCDA
ncbi:phosphoglycerate kinase, partial [Kipferlia bialata]